MADPTDAPPSDDERPTSAQLVELAHRSAAERPDPTLVFARLDDADRSIALGVGPLPADRHPADALVGLRAPTDWDAVGIVGGGNLHDPDRPSVRAGRGRFTLLVRRDAPGATLVEHPDGSVQLLDGDPEGWVVDVLRRVLGQPTAPPEGSTAMLIDTWWLDALVQSLVARRRHRPTWRMLAREHPMCPPGTIPTPGELAARTTAEAMGRPWSHLRSLAATAPLPARWLAIPEGEVISGDRWFDDGSLARWMLRGALPPDVLVAELLEHLTPQLVEQVGVALVELDLQQLAAA